MAAQNRASNPANSLLELWPFEPLSTRELTFYGHLLEDPAVSAFLRLVETLRALRQGDADTSEARQACRTFYRALLQVAYKTSATGLAEGPTELWQQHLFTLLLSDENEWTLLASRFPFEALPHSVIELAARDLRLLQPLWIVRSESINQALLQQGVPFPAWTDLSAALASLPSPPPGWLRLSRPHPEAEGALWSNFDQAMHVSSPDAASWLELARVLAGYHRQAGAGACNRYAAFRWFGQGATPSWAGISPVIVPDLDHFVGYEAARRQVIENTRRFLAGLPANNVLLFGDRGTGKSSTVLGLLGRFAPDGLRLVEVRKEQLADFAAIAAQLAPLPQHFLLFVDDLSFEEGDYSYAALKAALQGNLTLQPENVLIYATSNRRHLLAERFSQRQDEVHGRDALEEQLSLADRFGLHVRFDAPDQTLYLQLVERVAALYGIKADSETLRAAALQWEREENGRSPRTALQFVRDWIGRTGGS